MSRPFARHALLAVSSLFGVAASQAAVPDHIHVAVSRDFSVGSFGITAPAQLGAFGYDPVNDRLYITGNGTAAGKDIRRIDNFSTPAQQTATRLIANDPSWYLWSREDPNNGNGNPNPFGFLLNPKQIGSIAPYTKAWIIDGTTPVTVAGVQHPELTKRLYQYDLQPEGNDGVADNLTSLMTLQQYKNAVVPAITSNSSLLSRQFTWSGDGQSIYWCDSGSTTTAYGGLWKFPAAGGAPVQMLDTSINTELAVRSSGGVDTIYFTGQGGNAGGIDKVTHDGTNTSAITVAVPKATISDFLESSAAINSRSMATDAEGNLYFGNVTSTAPERRGIYRLDPQGRLSRVLSHAERIALNGSLGIATIASDTFRLQAWSGTFTNESGGSFTTTRLLFAESSLDAVAGVWVFKPGDFNRDNVVNQTDIQGDGAGFVGFKSKLTPRGQAVADVLDLKYDMNGNGAVDWKDVKILQQFYAFPDGDANIDQKVDTVDFNSLAGNFGKQTGALWTEGDFDGNQLIDSEDFNVLIANYGASIPLPGTISGSLVPEPVAFPAIAMGAFLFARRMRGQEARN